MQSKFIIVLAGAVALAGCNESVGGVGSSTFYDCGSGTRLKVDNLDDNRIMVQMNDDQPVTLAGEPSASGAKFMSATHQFWSKGNEATWTVGRMVPMTCNKVMLPRGM
ncbi:MliC family protein [Erythrobacter dokdonensis]|uniref:Membrane-bound lysozyme inhibitor of C-type lysozyme n=1 Tax=Erythrobacter dokdonensis DSW-74 TaxID=1300349 RepID=A0A1A7BGD1_9SPHN|nr:MliC family protein [Erythrobacter dokdonensis]OBV10270.1 Membrane-bound lysozyme inhibitor of C-type lysozyme [Erythrobacter dokdonensis DSW-74]